MASEPLLSSSAQEPTRRRRRPDMLGKAMATGPSEVEAYGGAKLVELCGQAASRWGAGLRASVDGEGGRPAPECFSHFDCSGDHLERLFKALIKHSDVDAFNLSVLRRALQMRGFEINAGNADDERLLEEIFKLLAQGGQILTMEAFAAGMRVLKQQVSLLPGQDYLSKRGILRVIDWSSEEVRDSRLSTRERHLQHLFHRPSPEFPTRWVHSYSPTHIEVMQLGVKYRLHPLAVEEFCLGKRLHPHVRKHAHDLYINMTLIRLKPASKKMLEEYRRDYKERLRSDLDLSSASRLARKRCSEQARVVVEVMHARVCLFVATPPRANRVLSLLSPWERLAAPLQQAPKPTAAGSHLVDARHLSSRELDLEEQENGDVFMNVLEMLNKDYSELRMGDSIWLGWAILDAAVESYSEVSLAYWARLDWYENNIEHKHADIDLVRIDRELIHILRKVEPLQALARHIASDEDLGTGVRKYLQNVEDEVGRVLEDIRRSLQLCHSLRDEVKAHVQSDRDMASYSLSLMAAFIIPFQFLSGVYGMNFQDSHGQGVVPLLGPLTLENSYFLFWGLGLGATALIWLCFTLRIGRCLRGLFSVSY
eukprot:TRINITY_DN74871_c0_g1_i1.p1 TRINITY_DN74871_c0_g1~~TRINITY_DN74871_c0_g1_i1.p1  ORF type:complete len:607 (+),score=91.56 TRINITY_DN74871_c0_g1_i1:39-1823(+)